jgi:nicotinate dehydrogenase subunit A
VQQAFLDEQAAQCGFCVSGILVTAAALLDHEPRPDEAAVAAALDRHLCRCGVQRRMITAVVRAGREGSP